ncbi:hypothetical protein MKX03_014828 [Papaver bracteatum]|nr:hypothetical protein MKX03_014828 [Papaver bracteatum]
MQPSIVSGEHVSKVLSTASLLNPSGAILDSFPRVIVNYLGKQHPFKDTFGARRGGAGTRIIRTPIRPLFPSGFYHDVQVNARVLSCRENHDIDVIAANATSAALMLSDIPWGGPIGVVRARRINGQVVVNPVNLELGCADIDLIYACTRDKTLMVDVQAQEITEKDLEAALKLAHQEAVKYIAPQIKLAKHAGKCKKYYKLSMLAKDNTVRKIEKLAETPFEAALFPDSAACEKTKGEEYLAIITGEAKTVLEAEEWDEEKIKLLHPHIVDKLRKMIFHRWNVEKGIRLDGRRYDEVRRVDCQSSSMSSGLQGSSYFACGATQLNLKFVDDKYLHFSKGRYFDMIISYPRYLYKTRPFRVDGDCKKCGHNSYEAEDGSFVENALLPLLPIEDLYPYVVCVNSQVVCNDGSASTVTVCGRSIALTDAGVPLRKHAAGVSMGLVREVTFGSTKSTDHGYRILTDLSNLEERLGDMNLKFAGSKEGITALQLDLNVAGVPLDIICECLEPALKAHLQILDRMEQEIRVPRYCVSNEWYWPYPIVAKYFLPAESFKRLINPGPGRYAEKGCFERDTGARITSTEEDRGIITLVAKSKISHLTVLEKLKDMDGIEVEVDYSTYYDDFVAARRIFFDIDSDDSLTIWLSLL